MSAESGRTGLSEPLLGERKRPWWWAGRLGGELPLTMFATVGARTLAGSRTVARTAAITRAFSTSVGMP